MAIKKKKEKANTQRGNSARTIERAQKGKGKPARTWTICAGQPLFRTGKKETALFN